VHVLIVHAHPEPTSFNAAMTRAAARELGAAGHTVEISDLYAMRFDPVSDRHNFRTTYDPARLALQAEERHASAHDGFAPDLTVEHAKLARASAVVFQFPLWWLGMPAIMKGWIDRVFAVGRAYGGGRWFDRGVMAGRRALCSVTVGGTADAYSSRGAYGDIATMLRPILHGTLAFVGFAVVEPFVVHAPGRLALAERTAELTRYARYVLALETAPTLAAVRSDDFDSALVRRSPPG
jgi:NAD(P)H dehydrogenase (quinone)